MMKAVNLHLITRVHDEKILSLLLREFSGRRDDKEVSPHEAASLWSLTDRLSDCIQDQPGAPAGSDSPAEPASDTPGAGQDIALLDGFYFSFTIQHIGKEFDLLKASANGECVLNIELKSEQVEEERIKRQLEQNRYYLSHIARTIYSFTYVMETDRLYTMNDRGFLRECGMEELAGVLRRKILRDYLPEGIEQCFKAADYLISPIASPEKFLQGKYFLTNQQFSFIRRIVENLQEYKTAGEQAPDRTPVISISGVAGTGKTLLLLELSLILSKKQRVRFLHAGLLRQGHLTIDSRLRNVDINSAGRISPADALSGYDYLLVDEADYLELSYLQELLSLAKEARVPVILAYDPHQLLFGADKAEQAAGAGEAGQAAGAGEAGQAAGAGEAGQAAGMGNKGPDGRPDDPDPGRSGSAAVLEKITESTTLALAFSGNIRINRPVYSFLRTLLNLKDHSGHPDYSCINVLYANNGKERDRIISYCRDLGYDLLSYAGDWERTSEMIAREYDKVLMVMDDTFYYDEALHLCVKGNEMPLRFIYEGLSRTRDSLCLLVEGNPELFGHILGIRVGNPYAGTWKSAGRRTASKPEPHEKPQPEPEAESELETELRLEPKPETPE